VQLFPARRVSGRGCTELHTLLIHADTEGPYVLVGHSYDGLYTQMYAARYSDEVAGVALVDSSHPEQFTRSPEGRAMYKPTRSPRRIQDPSLALAVCVVSPLCWRGGAFLCMMFPWLPARSGLLRAPVDGRGRKFNSPARAAELRHREPRSEDAAPPRTSTLKPRR
jgi:pimeloyl-ACP methyl ester carboxylesterase